MRRNENENSNWCSGNLGPNDRRANYTGIQRRTAQGRPCIFGPDHDQCLIEYLESIPGTTNNIDHLSGFKAGYADGWTGRAYHHLNATESWVRGYTVGWSQDVATREEP